jgi:enoyl-CoA hydratase/carnithine racemase
MTPEPVRIRLAREGPMAILTLDNPPVNALRTDMLAEIGERLEPLGKDGALALVITGSGHNAFCAGADVNEMGSLDLARGAEIQRRGQEVLSRLERSGLVSLAAINGYAGGGGLELALACDLRVASDRARFSAPEVGLGLIPAYGGTQRLPRLVGRAKAKELILTGRTIRADEALRLGLVNTVVPDGEELRATKDLAMQIASKAPLAVRAAKAAIHEGLELPPADGYAAESRHFETVLHSEDLREGLLAFLEKRPPKFQGK